MKKDILIGQKQNEGHFSSPACTFAEKNWLCYLNDASAGKEDYFEEDLFVETEIGRQRILCIQKCVGVPTYLALNNELAGIIIGMKKGKYVPVRALYARPKPHLVAIPKHAQCLSIKDMDLESQYPHAILRLLQTMALHIDEDSFWRNIQYYEKILRGEYELLFNNWKAITNPNV